MSNGIILFQNIATLAKAEKLLAGEGCSTMRIPAPKDGPTGCSIGLRFPWWQHDTIKSAMDKSGVQPLDIKQLPD
jgi:hypothetical protein